MDGNQRIELCEKAIEGITRELKGPMTNLERALLVADRKDWRAELATLRERKADEESTYMPR